MKSLSLATSRAALIAGILISTLMSSWGQTNFTLLRSMDVPDGGALLCTLALGSDGMLYGTAAGGGNANWGTVFKVAKDGTGLVALRHFQGGMDGRTPSAGVVEAGNGVLFGTTFAGGISNLGTIFMLNKDGSGYQVVHAFSTIGDGANPLSEMIVASDGALYGTTIGGIGGSRGVIYRLNADGTGYTIIYTFTGTINGSLQGKVIEGSDGALYGTSGFGGSGNLGTVFKINKDGSNHTILYNFRSAMSGPNSPAAGLCEGSDGALYGTTNDGGTGDQGVVFKINKDGSGYTVLHDFSSSGGDGRRPRNELIETTDGKLYGLTPMGGSANEGTIFRLNKDGSDYAVVRSFVGADGSDSWGSLIKTGDGIYHGVSSYGGEFDGGVIYSLSLEPLPPRITSILASTSSIDLGFATTSGREYDIQRSTNLTTWSTMSSFVAPVHGRSSYTDSAPPQPAAFFQLKLK